MVEVEIKSLNKSFKEVRAVDDISLNIMEGEFFSLLGPSGCGKTTLLRMLSGLEFPDSGSIAINGKDVTYAPAYNRPTNLVFQHLALFPHMTVEKNIAYGLRMKHTPQEEIEKEVREALRLVDLEGYGSRRPSQLSGGQQQRIAIARALVNHPRVLLFDEPLGALDLKLRLQLQVELKALQRKSGTTFIYVTHDQGEAMTMSDRIAVMRHGKIQQVGSPLEIYTKPQNSFVANFIGDTNLLQGTIAECKDGVVRIKVNDGMAVMGLFDKACTVGTNVHMSVRQELVKVGRDLSDLDNCFKAKVIDVIFAGSIVRYTVDAHGVRFVANVVNSVTNEIFSVGDEMCIGWDKGDMIVLED